MIPKVTVIVPIYNVEPYLPRCLDSLCRQTLQEIEIILVDDGSTDASGRIAEDYARRDDHFLISLRYNAPPAIAGGAFWLSGSAEKDDPRDARKQDQEDR